MKKRIKLSFTLICIVISLFALTYGVYAATSQIFSVSNVISFTASSVQIEITEINVYQATGVEGVGYTYKSQEPVVSTNNLYSLSENQILSWSGVNANFDSYFPYLVFSIKYNNKSGDYDSLVTVKNVTMPRNGSNISYLNFVNKDVQVVTISSATSNENSAQSTGSPRIAETALKSSNNNILLVAFRPKTLTTAFSGTLGFMLDFTKA